MFPRQSPNIYDLLIEKSYLCLTSNVNIKRAQRTQQNYSQLLFSSIADQKLFILCFTYQFVLFHAKWSAYAKFCCSSVLPSFLLRPSLGVFCFIMRQQVRPSDFLFFHSILLFMLVFVIMSPCGYSIAL